MNVWNHADRGTVDTPMRRLPLLATALTLVAAATACARQSAVPAEPQFADRARAVAAAWSATAAGPQWRSGLLPLQDLTVTPPDALPQDARQALRMGVFRSAVRLPDEPPAEGRVQFPDGPATPVPLVSAQAAYDDLHRADPPCPDRPTPRPHTRWPATTGPDGTVGGPVADACAALTVTAATLGTTTLRTSRGHATVPAWRFTVAEAPAPVVRVAVAPAALRPAPPVSVPSAGTSASFVGAHRLTSLDGNLVHFTIGIGACQKGPRGLVHETADVVVIGGDPGTSTSGECPAVLAYKPVSVTLGRPPDGRPIIDAMTGRLLPLGQPPW